jgi:hypothetical protein
MEPKETIITNIKPTKHGELIMTLKFKIGEIQSIEEAWLRDCWMDGKPLEIAVIPYQEAAVDPSQSSL